MTAQPLGPRDPRTIEHDVRHGTDYWSRVRKREKYEDGIPWDLGDKESSRHFFESRRYPIPATLRQFQRVSEIELASLPTPCVLKPTFAHTSAGVYIIEAAADGYFDRFRGQAADAAEIHREMSRLFTRFGRNEDQVNFVAEEVVEDIDGAVIPIDYKFLMFYDVVGLCIAVDRNVSPPCLHYWSEDFLQLPPGAVFHPRPDKFSQGDREAPAFLSELVEFAASISTSLPIPMCRVDLYMTPKGPVLGEITLLPGNFYYEDDMVMSAGLSAHLGALWGRAEQRIASDFGRYPVCDGTLSLDALLTLGRPKTPPVAG